MMTTTQTETDPFALVAAHIESIKPALQAAWRGPVVRNYKTGAVVWMWDHYNTAIIEGPGRHPDTWAITTADADGSESRFEYTSGSLRPAATPVEFRW